MIEFLKRLFGIVAASSRLTSAGATTGGLALLFAPALDLDPHLAFLAGFLLPLAPLTFWLTSEKAMKRRLQTLQQWKQEGLIQAKEYDQLRKQALRWYGERLYGPAQPEESAQSPTPSAGNPSTIAPPAPQHPPP